jgi:hypothetical protein
MIVEAGDHYALFIVSAKKGEAEDYIGVLQTMAGAVEVATIDDDAEIQLTQTISSMMEEAGELTVYYPEGWAARVVDGLLFVGDSEDTLDKLEADEPPEAGDIGGLLIGLPVEAISFVVTSEDPTAIDVLNSLTGFMDDEKTTFELGEAEEFSVNGRKGALVIGTGTEDDMTFDALFAGVFEGEDFIILVMRSNVGDMGQYIEVAKAMLGAAEFEFEAP